MDADKQINSERWIWMNAAGKTLDRERSNDFNKGKITPKWSLLILLIKPLIQFTQKTIQMINSFTNQTDSVPK